LQLSLDREVIKFTARHLSKKNRDEVPHVSCPSKHHVVASELASYSVGWGTMQRCSLLAVTARSRSHKVHCKAPERNVTMRFLMHPALLSTTLLPVSWLHTRYDGVQCREVHCWQLTQSRQVAKCSWLLQRVPLSSSAEELEGTHRV
jgi:hypothetical protein